jgi:hypothetical protein
MAASPLAAALLGGNQTAFLDPTMAAAQPDLQLGQSLLEQGMSTAPASPWQALARVAQAGAGTYLRSSAMSDLAKAYAHSADSASATLPEGHPLRAALASPDPVIRMQGLQAYQKALTLMSEGTNLPAGENRYIGGAVVSSNTGPQSPEGKLQQDIDRTNGRQGAPSGVPLGPPAVAMPPAPAVLPARPGMAPRTNAGVPLGPPQMGGIESVTGMSAPTPAPAFADRFDASRPSGVPSVKPTTVPSNPLQGAIDIQAAKAGATKGAEEQAAANVQFGDLLQPQQPPRKGPGGTEALTTTHGTLVPPLTDQAPLPKSPAEAKPRVDAWQKTQEGWHTGLQPGYQAEQRLNTIAQTFKTMQTGYGAEQKAQVASLLKSIGVNLPESIMADPAKVETAIHENYVETLQQLKASTPRFTQMEFKALSENKEHPNLQPAANLQMLSEDIGQLRQARDLPRDFVEAQQHGWRDPQSFEQAWLRHNPLKGYVDKVRGEIGPLKGMAPEGVVGSAAASAAAGPAAGYVHNGYRFKGGDPNSKTSWEKVAP